MIFPCSSQLTVEHLVLSQGFVVSTTINDINGEREEMIFLQAEIAERYISKVEQHYLKKVKK